MPDRDEWNRKVIEEFRANNGTMVSGMFKGAPLLLLHSTGRKSGGACGLPCEPAASTAPSTQRTAERSTPN